MSFCTKGLSLSRWSGAIAPKGMVNAVFGNQASKTRLPLNESSEAVIEGLPTGEPEIEVRKKHGYDAVIERYRQ